MDKISEKHYVFVTNHAITTVLLAVTVHILPDIDGVITKDEKQVLTQLLHKWQGKYFGILNGPRNETEN